MADANFNRKSVKELQKYLKERGVTFSDMWDKMKATLAKFYELHYLPVLLRRNNLR